jgi:hypothetical protein
MTPFKITLTGYIHTTARTIVYTSQRSATKLDALIEALEWAAMFPGDFDGTVTAA